ncbi:MAG: Uncharacterised protein [Bacteroidota bacterium]|nr:MAG: Uncharacterised protein [Bacteroidota bacterium]
MKSIFIATLVFSFSLANAQQIKATYSLKVTRNVDFKGNPNMPKQVIERIKKRLAEPVSYDLFFDQTQSIYKQQQKLDTPQSQSGGRGDRWMRYGASSQNIIHTNLATRKQTNQQDLFGKIFLVKKDIKIPKWNFTGESKQIGQYTAYEATYTQMQNPPQFRMPFGRRGGADQEEEKKPEKIEVTVSAWFTPDIPISAGPDSYFGLPGLVLMVQDNNKVLVCTEVQMNSKEKIKLTPPKKGKEVTGNEFNKIREEKSKEMRDRFQNNSNRNSQNRMFIRN